MESEIIYQLTTLKNEKSLKLRRLIVQKIVELCEEFTGIHVIPFSPHLLCKYQKVYIDSYIENAIMCVKNKKMKQLSFVVGAILANVGISNVDDHMKTIATLLLCYEPNNYVTKSNRKTLLRVFEKMGVRTHDVTLYDICVKSCINKSKCYIKSTELFLDYVKSIVKDDH